MRSWLEPAMKGEQGLQGESQLEKVKAHFERLKQAPTSISRGRGILFVSSRVSIYLPSCGLSGRCGCL